MKVYFPATKLVQRMLYPVINMTIALLIYAAVLIIGIPQEVALAARYGFTTVLVAIALVLYPAYRLSGWTEKLASLSFTLVLFALPLSALWNSGLSESFLIGGLLPWNDASRYYWDARRLLEGETFSAFSSRRPFFSGILATLLGLTQQNLQVTLAILVAITAISCFFAAREVQRSHGVGAGLLVITLLFLFYRKFLGKTLTENLGLSLGAVGFAILWRGARQKQINNCLLGILLLTIALNARAGAFFILPAILLWGAWLFRGATRVSSRFLLSGGSVILLGFILNSILLKIIGAPDSMAFSNFSYSLYGLIVGGNWTQVLQDHPELKSLSDPEAARRIYTLAFEALRENPLALVTGSVRAWKQFMFGDYVFSFINKSKANFVLQLLSLVALFVSFRQRREPNASLIIVTSLGILASVPFVPPWDTLGMRAYAATIPFISILPALGFTFIAKKMEWHQLVKVPTEGITSQHLTGFSIIFAIFVFVAPITTKIFSRAPQFANVYCKDGMAAVYFRISPGSSVNLVPDNSIRQTHLPNVRISDFRNGLVSFSKLYNSRVSKRLVNLNPYTTIMNSFNLGNMKDETMVWLIAKSSIVPKKKGIFVACGKWEANLNHKKYSFFYTESIQKKSLDN